MREKGCCRFGCPQPPRIENLFPADGTRFYPTDGGLGFKVSTVTPNRIEKGEIRLILNGEDVSSDLSIRGDPSEWRVEYEIPLEEDLLHTIKVVVMAAILIMAVPALTTEGLGAWIDG